jgi:hypothetical protein
MREPLRAAFGDPKTPPAGRIEIARALDDLGDDSWREAVLAMAKDPQLDPELRRKAAELLGGAAPEGVVDEPRARLVTEPPRRESVARKKEERPPRETSTMAAALFLGGSLLTLGILLWALRRKD